MKKRILIILLLIGVILSFYGCAPMRDPLYVWEPPSYKSSESNVAFYYKSPEAVWNKLIKELSYSGFKIDRTNKEFGIIDASFEMKEDIDDYIECGSEVIFTTITVDYPGVPKGDITYKFNPCKRHRIIVEDPYRMGSRKYVPRIIDYVRVPVLSGKVNIHIVPEDGGTSVMVNCDYIFTIRIYGTSNMYNEFGVGPISTVQYNTPYFPNVTFSTIKRRGRGIWRGSRFTCFNKGTLETEILDMI